VIKDEFLVKAVEGGAPSEFDVASLAGGGFIVSWTEGFSGQIVKAKAFDGAGSASGGEFPILGVGLAGLANGDVVVEGGNQAEILRKLAVLRAQAVSTR
jgi:hypothetical protein